METLVFPMMIGFIFLLLGSVFKSKVTQLIGVVIMVGVVVIHVLLIWAISEYQTASLQPF